MPKLNQIITVVAGKKSRTQQLLTETHRGWNKDAIAGIVKRYTPRDESGDKLPPESKNIHLDTSKKVEEITKHLVDFWDVVATQECGNVGAKAPVIVDGNAILSDQPVTVLLFFEKQIEDLRTFVNNLPALPSDRTWKWDSNRNCYVTDPVETVRTQKVIEPIVKYPATPEHPAQTELISKDVSVGTWETIYLSSAIPEQKKAAMIERINSLADAIKSAREEANSVEVRQQKLGQSIIDYVFAD